MGDDKDKGPLVSISGVLLVLAAFGATLFVQPFKGDRPSVPEIRESYEKVNARLWQDPFRAILDSSKGSDAEPEAAYEFYIDKPEKSTDSSQKRLKNSIKDKKEKITVLGVMVPGAPYADDTEMRMRLRYAVLSGLCRLDFTPDDPEHIEFIRIKPSAKKGSALNLKNASSDKSTPKKNLLSNIVPYEWMTHKQGGTILVLWLNDNVFQKDPLQYLSNLAGHLRHLNDKKIKDFKVIGPATSDSLVKMVKKSDGKKELSLFQGFNKPIHIYSAMATIDNKFLLREKIDNRVIVKLPAQNIKEDQPNKIVIERTIGTDEKLAGSLVEELINRKIDVKDKDTHIVLVTESDTSYGRYFSENFVAALKEDDSKQKPESWFDKWLKGDGGGWFRKLFPYEGKPSIEELNKDLCKRIHLISYLRGIDGSLPGEKEKKKDEKADAKSDPLKDIKKLEQPVGKSQYDYLRRLADEIYRLDQDLLYVKGEGGVKAIGVLGTDFYDKYLVLQALRQRIPDAVYFTTDLDARMLHPEHTQWTRNLVVASNFDLSLRNDDVVNIQGAVPPFRDNYQTSVFLTVLWAFKDSTTLEQNVLTMIDQYMMGDIKPLLFEIGRYSAVNLSPASSDKQTIHPGKSYITNPPEWYKQPFWRIMGISTVMIFAALIILYFTSPSIYTFLKRPYNRAATVFIAGLLFVIAYVVYKISHQPGEEPFSLFEGISIWPTQLFRLAAILLSCRFLYWLRRDQNKNMKSIESKVFNGNVGPSLVNRPPLDQIDWKLSEVAPGSTLNNLWSDYVRRDSNYRCLRVFIIALVYCVFCWLVISLFGKPVTPVRGGFSTGTNKFILVITIALFAFLAFYVLDVTRSCRKFIDIASAWFAEHQDSSTVAPSRAQIEEKWTLIRLIAMRTEAVGKLIFYPFIVWLFIFISRFHYSDNWTTPKGLAAVICLGAMLPWICAFLLRRSAERARTRVLVRLRDQLFNIRTGKCGAPAKHESTATHIAAMIKRVKDIRQGAFAPFSQHPVVQSLLIPFGGVGGAYLIDFFTKTNF